MKDGDDEQPQLNTHQNLVVIDKDKKFMGFSEFNKYCDSAGCVPFINVFDIYESWKHLNEAESPKDDNQNIQ